MLALWDHQDRAIVGLRDAFRDGYRRVMMQAPTGSGKTKMAAAIFDSARDKGHRVAFVVPSISLVDQTVEAFYSEGLRDIGVIQAGHHMTDWSKPIQICSIQTIAKRQAWPDARIFVLDEAHVLFEAHKEKLKAARQPGSPDLDLMFIGLSATPYTKGLGNYFDKLITVATTQELIDKGILSRYRVFATGHPDLSGVRVSKGDYVEAEASAAMQDGGLTADIVQTYRKRWGKGKTLLFAVDCKHAQVLQSRFIEAGIACGYQDANTPADERAEIKRRFHDGYYEVVSNVGTLTTGVDWDVRCLILARPTKSIMMYKQIVGRALRTAPDKDHAVILDHSSTSEALGLVTDVERDYLDDGKDRGKVEKRVLLPKACPKCTALRPPRVRVCVQCGYVAEATCSIHESDGELVEFIGGKVPKSGAKKAREWTSAEKRQFFLELRCIARDRNYNPKWATAKYKLRIGMWPAFAWRDLPAAAYASTATLQWVLSTNIAWAKGRRHAES